MDLDMPSIDQQETKLGFVGIKFCQEWCVKRAILWFI